MKTKPGERPTQLALDFSGAASHTAVAPPAHSLWTPDGHIAYQLKRSSRRTIGFRIDERGLIVTAPRRTSQADIEQSILRKARWIHEKTAQWHNYRPTPTQSFVWGDGVRFPYLGEEIALKLSAPALEYADGTLHLPLPLNATPERIRKAVRAWLDKQALMLYHARVEHFAPLLGVTVQHLRLSSAHTRWGSCSAKGRISLHRQLIQLPLAWIDYVVVHELAHLREMNHSPRFWGWVASVLPDYKEAQTALRKAGHLIQMP